MHILAYIVTTRLPSLKKSNTCVQKKTHSVPLHGFQFSLGLDIFIRLRQWNICKSKKLNKNNPGYWVSALYSKYQDCIERMKIKIIFNTQQRLNVLSVK